MQLGFDVRQRLPLAILVGHHRNRQRPLEAQARVVVRQTAFRTRRVELADLVGGLGVVFERLVAVGESLGNVDAAVVVGAQLDR